MLYYILYVSYANEKMSEEQLKTLLLQSMQNNKEFGITGMLLYIDGKFIQLIEGPKDHILRLYEKIEQDERHRKVSIILEGQTSERMFPDWQMAFKAMDIEAFEALSGYKDIVGFFSQRTIDNQSHPAKIFLRLFYDKNYRDFADLG